MRATLDIRQRLTASSRAARCYSTLSAFQGLPNVRLRFTVNGNHSTDGWYLDDVTVDDACPNVLLNAPTQITEHGMRVSWSASGCGDFKRYELYRDTDPVVDRTSTLVATITNSVQTSLDDLNLKHADRTYYYRLYVIDTQELVNQGSGVASGHTLDGIPTPIVIGGGDDFEGADQWGNDLPGTIITSASACHSGTHCWHDSPAGVYANNEDLALTTKLDLTTAMWPLLTFWQRYNLEAAVDFGYVETSPDKVNWTKRLFTTGNVGATWQQETIDLSQFAGQTLFVRFRLVTNAAVVADGWYVDDVAVVENAAPPAGYPFSDDMEAAASDGRWIPATWRRVATDCHSGTQCWHDSPAPNGQSIAGVVSSLVLAGALDLTGAVNPQLSYWQRIPEGEACCHDVFQVSASGDDGLTWTLLTYVDYTTGPLVAWTRVQADLSAFQGLPNVRLRFTVNGNHSTDGWYLDDVTVADE